MGWKIIITARYHASHPEPQKRGQPFSIVGGTTYATRTEAVQQAVGSAFYDVQIKRTGVSYSVYPEPLAQADMQPPSMVPPIVFLRALYGRSHISFGSVTNAMIVLDTPWHLRPAVREYFLGKTAHGHQHTIYTVSVAHQAPEHVLTVEVETVRHYLDQHRHTRD